MGAAPAGSGSGSLRAISDGTACLGIEFGSTRIKACLIDAEHQVIGVGSDAWENTFVDGIWSYDLNQVWTGLHAAYANLLADLDRRGGARPVSLRAIGVSAMMHGYLPFDDEDRQLVPFRTWRNTSTGAAAAALSDLLGCNIPLRWSVAHLAQAVLDGEAHVARVRCLTTLAGYVHWRLTGRRVLGISDACGMFPVDPATGSYDAELMARADGMLRRHGFDRPLGELLPDVLGAGRQAGRLSAEGARLLDPSGTLRPGVPLCPPEGDAGTGMVATGSVAPRTGNVSVGTSVFAMVVLERPLKQVHPKVDVVATPTGAPVAMVHCNNGASELAAWAAVFQQFAAATGGTAGTDDVFAVLMHQALSGEPDGGGLLAYNQLSGEPIAGGLTRGRPLIVRTPQSHLTLANLSRALVYGVFGTLSLGLRVLAREGVRLDTMYAHGGLLRTPGAAQRLLAAAVGAPVAVHRSASEGGAWGIAVLAAYAAAGAGTGLEQYLTEQVFAGDHADRVDPDPADVHGYARFLERYEAGLAVEKAAADAL